MLRDWVKMRTDLYRDPKVILMADMLLKSSGRDGDVTRGATRNVMRNATVGALVTVWGVLRHSGRRDGDDLVIPKAQLTVIDGIAEMAGMGEAMAFVGWAKASSDGVRLPEFFAENNVDPSDDSRAKAAERQRRYRRNKSVTGDGDSDVTGDVTGDGKGDAREEKRREEVDSSNTETQEPQGTAKPARVCFRKPNAQDVAEYATGICANVDPQEFIDHYTSNGWKVGKAPMKDWKAAVRNWAKRDLSGKAKTDAAVRAGFTRQAQQDAQWDAFREFERLAAQDDELDRQELVAGGQDGSQGRGASNHAALLGKGPGPNDPF